MAVAMVYPEPIKIKRSGSVIITDPGVDPSYLSHARTVLQYAPDLADNILAGSSSLDEAYETAHVRNDRARLAKLRDERPDLAELVSTEAMSLDDALAKAAAEAEERKQQRWASTSGGSFVVQC